jgi:Flp pilus assembly protein TadD
VPAGIFELFHVARGRRCVQPGCTREIVPLHTTTCDQCGHPLPVVWGWRRWAVTAAGIVALLFAAALAWGLREWGLHRAALRRTALVATASHDLEARLQGKKFEEVGSVAEEVQQRFGLTTGERTQLIDAAGPVIATLPREVTPEIERTLETHLRAFYRDLHLDPTEAAQLRAYCEEQRLAETDVAAIEQDLLAHMRPAAEHLRRGKTLVARRMYSQAEDEYRRATEVDPGDPLAWAQLGAVLARLDRADEALACYRRALELDPLNWLAHYNLAVWHARRGETDETLAGIEEALTSAAALPGGERQAVVQAMLEEPALEKLRHDPRFSDLIAAAPTTAATGAGP